MRELVGIVGAGRSRGGLGPFLAEFIEQEGLFVAGVSGRSFERATVNAKALGTKLRHEVKPSPSPAALCATGVAALVIASRAEFHLEALQAAAEAGLPALCEKPLVHENHGKEGAEVIEVFSRKRLPLLENCQWPYVLPAFFQLHGAVENGECLTVELGLGPLRPGREMVQNTVSHLLSLIQAVAPVDSNAVVSEVSIADPFYKKTHNLLHFRIAAAPGKTVEGMLHLEICPVGPRPAWLAINGRRIDRSVGPGYTITFSANSTEVAAADPMKELVKRFALLVRSRDSVLIEEDCDRIRQRHQWYRQILDKLR
jgi:GFO/IDH/MocA oxidoreductase family protein